MTINSGQTQKGTLLNECTVLVSNCIFQDATTFCQIHVRLQHWVEVQSCLLLQGSFNRGISEKTKGGGVSYSNLSLAALVEVSPFLSGCPRVHLLKDCKRVGQLWHHPLPLSCKMNL